MKIPKLYVGTAGWSYKDWRPTFYPKQQSQNFNYLKFYANYFNVVEVNSSYYKYWDAKVIEKWIKQVDDIDNFVFTFKLHKDFTHLREFNDENIKSVQESLSLLAGSERLGGLLIQFPYSFECHDGNIAYLARLLEIFAGYPKFVEVKHPSWKNKKASSITFCSVDKPELSEIFPFQLKVSNKSAYLRLYGREKPNTDNREQYLYSPGELLEIEYELKKIYSQAEKIFVIMKRHAFGNSLANAFEMMHFLEESKKIKMPPTIIKAYPRLKKFCYGLGQYFF